MAATIDRREGPVNSNFALSFEAATETANLTFDCAQVIPSEVEG
jgi:hypothetical protein